jgi:hypothetical protein
MGSMGVGWELDKYSNDCPTQSKLRIMEGGNHNALAESTSLKAPEKVIVRTFHVSVTENKVILTVFIEIK